MSCGKHFNKPIIRQLFTCGVNGQTCRPCLEKIRDAALAFVTGDEADPELWAAFLATLDLEPEPTPAAREPK